MPPRTRPNGTAVGPGVWGAPRPMPAGVKRGGAAADAVKAADMTALKALYVSSIDGSDPAGAAAAAGNVGLAEAEGRLAALEAGGSVERDGGGCWSLTDVGRSSLAVVFAGGVFDIIHPGHIHTLKAARRLGDVLVVVVATDATARRMKKRAPLHSQDERRGLVASLSTVDLCLVGDESDIFRTVDRVRPQVIALGYDQVHQEKYIMDGCRRLGLDVRIARLQSPVPEISSSKIEAQYGDAIHGT